MFRYPPFIVMALLLFILSFVPVFGGSFLPTQDQELWKGFLAAYYPVYTFALMVMAGVMGNKYARHRICERARQARQQVKVH